MGDKKRQNTLCSEKIPSDLIALGGWEAWNEKSYFTWNQTIHL